MQNLLQKLGVNIELHDQLIAYNARLFDRVFTQAQNRPAAMDHFDWAFHASHAERVREIYEFRAAGGKAIGTFCIFVPDEIALAAGVLPFPSLRWYSLVCRLC